MKQGSFVGIKTDDIIWINGIDMRLDSLLPSIDVSVC